MTKPFCDGLTRRGFLTLGACGLGLTLADALRLQAETPKPKRLKSAIFVYLPGGPSHIDTYDPKPEAPAEYRGEFRAIATKVAGIQICEHFPRQAALFDKLAVIRSLSSVDEHGDSLVMTGYPERTNRVADHPSFGAVVSKARGADADVPPFVSLRGLTRGTEPGFLGISHRPFTPSGPGDADLRPTVGVDAARLQDRKKLLGAFDGLRRDLDSSGTLDGIDAYSDRAVRMILSGVVRDALDLTKEPKAVREKYKDVEMFLTARRLIEAGAGFVTLGYGSWDTHAKNFESLKKQLPIYDRGISNLIEELHDRGLARDVVVVVMGEFGRTPKINRDAGRDHWPAVMSALVSGGGLTMGQAIGSSSEKGERIKERPYTVPNLLGTVYRAIGIDPAGVYPNQSGRPVHILDDREPVQELGS